MAKPIGILADKLFRVTSKVTSIGRRARVTNRHKRRMTKRYRGQGRPG